MKKILISEQEKNEILNKHKNFKKILENELEKLNRGLTLEQTSDKDVLDAAETVGCLRNGKIETIGGKEGYVKIAKGSIPNVIEVGDKIVQYADFTFFVYPKGSETPKGPYKWECDKLDNSTTTTSSTQTPTTTPTTTSNKSKYELDREKTDEATEQFLKDFRPNVDGCVKMIERFYETWENDITNMKEELFNELKSETQTCANYFNGSWKGKLGRGPVRKKIELLQGGIGGTESSSKWRLLTPRKK